MIKKIDHIGVAVKDIEKALSLFRDVLGVELEGTEEVDTQKVRVAMLPVGDTRLELIEPTQEDSNVAKFLEIPTASHNDLLAYPEVWKTIGLYLEVVQKSFQDISPQ